MANEIVLFDVSELVWGRNGECTFIGSLEVVLNYLGETYDYVDLMGLSAAAFRLMFHHPTWCASSPDASLGPYPTYIMDAIQYEGAMYRNDGSAKSKAKLWEHIKSELHQDRPILACDLVKPPDWGIITGYRGNQLLCRTYWDRVRKDSLRKEGTYIHAEKFPSALFTIKRKPARRKDTTVFRKSILHAVDIAFKPSLDKNYSNGLAAYDVWINDLADHALFSAMDAHTFQQHWQINAWIYDSLWDARYAAVNYLKRLIPLFFDHEKEIIREAMLKFEEIRQQLFEEWVHFPMPFWVNHEENKIWIPGDRFIQGSTWTQEMRDQGAEVLRKIKYKEQQAFQLLSQISSKKPIRKQPI